MEEVAGAAGVLRSTAPREALPDQTKKVRQKGVKHLPVTSRDNTARRIVQPSFVSVKNWLVRGWALIQRPASKPPKTPQQSSFVTSP